MIAQTSLKTVWKRSVSKEKMSKFLCPEIEQSRKFSSSYISKNNNNNSNNEKKKQEAMPKPSPQKAARAPDIPSFMPVVNIPLTELAHNAFYSLHRPLLGLSTPKPFLAGNLVGQIKKEDDDHYSDEALLQYLSKLRPFEPPLLEETSKEEGDTTKCSTTTLTVEVDPSYFLNHNNNHDEIADYLTAIQEKLDLLYDERAATAVVAGKKLNPSTLIAKKKMKRLRKRKGFFEKN